VLDGCEPIAIPLVETMRAMNRTGFTINQSESSVATAFRAGMLSAFVQ
jgi:hypothetical protein